MRNEGSIEADVPHQGECRSPITEDIRGMTIWLNIDGIQHPQALESQLNDDKTYNVFTKITFNKTVNQKYVSCGVKWWNKTYTSVPKKVNLLCEFISVNSSFHSTLPSIILLLSILLKNKIRHKLNLKNPSSIDFSNQSQLFRLVTMHLQLM